MEKWVLGRHKAVFAILRPLLSPFFKLIYGVKGDHYKMKKDRPYLLLSNHQALLDPVFIAMYTDRPIHFMATDNVFSNGFVSKLLVHFIAPIPKKKQGADLQAMRACMAIAKKNGVVGVFPEGSRSYSGVPTEIDMGIVQLARYMKADVLLCRIEGGYGVDPRWGKGLRKGRFFVRVAEALDAETVAQRSDEELLATFTEVLAVSDAPSETPYKSKKRAEGIESAVYLCPRCGAVETLSSEGIHFRCSACGLTGEYTEYLTLKFDDENIDLSLQQWMQLQDDWRKRYTPEAGAVIFSDSEVVLSTSDVKKAKRDKLGEGSLQLTDTALTLHTKDGEDMLLPVEDIKIISPVGGRKLVVTTGALTYFIKGSIGFNPIKYTQMVYHLQGRDDRLIK
ncbi:MAG: 1-acyl-sn-glycerol-3-phosphate acyltransferase [Oscillospiraceae bacterium]|nr:1-acyl-sn-glycerol-3-phosphate acyltransferase [Oscillospiraceae bacterium]